MKVLLTAFGAFPGVPINPSQVLLEGFAKPDALNFQLHKVLLPVDYSYCVQWLSTLTEEYDLVIHMGVANNASQNQVELQAKNYRGLTPDTKGFFCEGKISLEKPEVLMTDLSFDFLEGESYKQIVKSRDAGDYLCNFLYFKSLEKGSFRRVLFYHLAPDSIISADLQQKLLAWLLEQIFIENYR
ncbi:MAG: hypothetical protein MK132_01335 [Lentisphaerales bacterium]|nr:hypothetical protein [Lentisphaerales bacterium]